MNHNNVNKIILVCAVIYLAFPNLLWLFGWVETWVASIIGAFLIFCLFHWLAKKKSDVVLEPITLAHVLPLALCCTGIVFLMGFNGIVPQPGDFIVRNALYDALINSDWPLYSNRGEYFVYYHAFVLLPALVASLFSSVPSWILIAMWVWLGLVLASCCLAMRYRRRTTIFLALLMLLGTPAAIFQLDHHFLANYWPIKDVVALYRYFLPVPLSYPGMWNQCADTYNHGIIVLLFLSMMHGKLLRGKDVVLASGLVVVCSPIAAPVILFFLFLSAPLFSCKKIICDLMKTPLFYAELVLLSLLFAYYTSASILHVVLDGMSVVVNFIAYIWQVFVRLCCPWWFLAGNTAALVHLSQSSFLLSFCRSYGLANLIMNFCSRAVFCSIFS